MSINHDFWLGVCQACQLRYNQPIQRWQCMDYGKMSPNDWPAPDPILRRLALTAEMVQTQRYVETRKKVRMPATFAGRLEPI